VKLASYIKSLTENLESLYPKEEAKAIAYFFIEEELGISKNKILIEPELDFDNKTLKKIKQKETRLLKGEPVQYVVNYAHFYGLKFFVNKTVLIPRQETEILVDFLIKRHRKSKNIKILDIGTGSGCIPISLKKNIPNSELYAIDISEDALKICSKNAKNNGVVINILKHNILSENEIPTNLKFDLIVSNPPYVLKSERAFMHKNVVDYEPEIALYVENQDPLIYYRHILNLSGNISHEKTELIFEINENFAKEIIKLNKKSGFTKNVIIKDLCNKDRFVFSEKQ
jgi:release factor glutamine methyltransferase